MKQKILPKSLTPGNRSLSWLLIPCSCSEDRLKLQSLLPNPALSLKDSKNWSEILRHKSKRNVTSEKNYVSIFILLVLHDAFQQIVFEDIYTFNTC